MISDAGSIPAASTNVLSPNHLPFLAQYSDRESTGEPTVPTQFGGGVPQLASRYLFSSVLIWIWIVLTLTSGLANNLLVFHDQKRYFLPLIEMGRQSYFPIVQLLQILDLPYSESVSSGYLRIFPGKVVIEVNRNQSVARLNQSSILLPADVLFDQDQWLVPLEFVPQVLNKGLVPGIKIASAGDRWSTGGIDFIRLKLTTTKLDQATRIVINPVNAGEIVVRKNGTRVVFSLGNTPIESPGSEISYRDERVEAVFLEETAESSQLVVQLANESIEARITRIANQEVYLLEAYSQLQGEVGYSRVGEVPFLLPSEGESRRWRRIIIDAGHGGADLGALVKEGLHEKDVTLSIARKIRWILEAELAVEVVLSRSEDETLSLEDRVFFANRGRFDLFLSIHLGNWNSSSVAKSYVYLAKMPPLKNDLEVREEEFSFVLLPWDQAQARVLHRSFRLAEALQIVINELFNGGESLNHRHAPLRLLSSLGMPAVLLELGNVNHPDFRERVLTDQFQKNVTVAVLSALEQFRKTDESIIAGKDKP